MIPLYIYVRHLCILLKKLQTKSNRLTLLDDFKKLVLQNPCCLNISYKIYLYTSKYHWKWWTKNNYLAFHILSPERIAWPIVYENCPVIIFSVPGSGYQCPSIIKNKLYRFCRPVMRWWKQTDIKSPFLLENIIVFFKFYIIRYWKKNQTKPLIQTDSLTL